MIFGRKIPEYRMCSKDILMRCNFKSRSGEKSMLFLKVFVFIAIKDRLVSDSCSREMGSEYNFSEFSNMAYVVLR